MQTIHVSPESPLTRQMRKAVQRGKLQVVCEDNENVSLGGGKLIVSDHGSAQGWIPEFLYKYTNDAGVAGLREGLIRFGSALEYQKSENQSIRDANEHSILSRIAPVYDPYSKEFSLQQFSLKIPGAIFCASMDASLRGAFPDYNRQVVIRTKPFLAALGNAIFEFHHFVQFDKNNRACRLQFLVPSGDKLIAAYPSHSKQFMEYSKVEYVDELQSSAHPLELQRVCRMGNSLPMSEIAQYFAGNVLTQFKKDVCFQHEKEYRVVLSFAHSGPMRKVGDGEYMDDFYFTHSFLIKIDAPCDVFVF